MCIRRLCIREYAILQLIVRRYVNVRITCETHFVLLIGLIKASQNSNFYYELMSMPIGRLEQLVLIQEFPPLSSLKHAPSLPIDCQLVSSLKQGLIEAFKQVYRIRTSLRTSKKSYEPEPISLAAFED
ncbi:unnamed protein product [Protopolystoma xenopodis]|uniref:Uncharacterized protein n=1 Tax=Protopolystoma xenopodis TaxID=117903 RepID=A0A3S5B2C3_9PLAT|nr:unnamed protein product [Protopolystoma xenopodis]